MQLLEERTDTNLDPRQLLTAVAKGDLSQTMALEINKRPLQGELLCTAITVNRMVNQRRSFVSEVTREARGWDGRRAWWPKSSARSWKNARRMTPY